MAGNTLVIGGRFISNEAAMRKVVGGDDHPAGSFAVRSSDLVMGCHRRLESWNRLNRHGCAGNIGKELWQLGLHLPEVLTVLIEDLLSGGRNVLRILRQGR